MIERYSAQQQMRAASSNDAIIDAHTHSGTDNYNVLARRYPSSQSVSDLVLKLNANGVDFALNFVAPGSYFYFDFPQITENEIYVPNPAEDYPYQASNRQMFYEIELFGEDKVLPFFTIYPGHGEDAQAQEIDRLSSADLLFGLKLHTLATRTKATELKGSPYIEMAQKHSLPLLIHSRDGQYSEPSYVIELAKMYPDLRFCIAHAAMFDGDIFEAARALGNVFIDIAPFQTLCALAKDKDANGNTTKCQLDLPFGDPKQVLRTLAESYPELVLWGTDEPWTTVTNDRTRDVFVRSTYRAEVDILRTLPPDLRRQISNTNTVKYLFG